MEALTEMRLRHIERMAEVIRERVIEMLLEAGSGHSAGPLGMADIFAALYFHILKHDPKKPNWDERDRVVLSNGHICPVQYATLSLAGYFPESELKTLRKIDSRLQGHPHRASVPGVETTSGPLGCGLSQAIGMALAARLDHKKHRIFCIASDGEHDEGNHWEAVLFAAKMKLDNLTLIVDRNGIQIDGRTEKVLPLEPLREKYEAHRWHALEIDGNDIEAFVSAVVEAGTVREGPTVIIAKTVPGKGVSFMEGDYRWHGKAPNREEAERALHELKAIRDRLESD